MNTEEYARWFRASTPYISAHHGKVFVVLLPSAAIAHVNLTSLVHDLALMHVLGARLVIVHGAESTTAAALPDHGAAKDAAGRVLTAADISALAGVCGGVRARLEAIFATGLPTSPLHNVDVPLISGNFVHARPLGVVNGVDCQYAGQPRRVAGERIKTLLAAGNIVLLSPIGYSPAGEALGLAIEELAQAAALAVSAEKLIVLDEVPCLPDADGERLGNLTPEDLLREVTAAEARLSAATARHLRLLAHSVELGVASGQMVGYTEAGALLAELYTAAGSGTQVTREARSQVRPAHRRDLADLAEVIRPLEDEGLLVERTRDQLERDLQHFLVAEADGFVVGCCAVYPVGKQAELACLAVHPAYRNDADINAGPRLLAAAEASARAAGCDALFVLTTRARDWFLERGFSEASVADLPAARQARYDHARKSQILRKRLQ